MEGVLKFSMFRSREDKTYEKIRIIQHFKDNQIINAIASVYLEACVIYNYGYSFTDIRQKRTNVVNKLHWKLAYDITIQCGICFMSH